MSHFTVIASNVDDTVSFYVELLGLRVGKRPSFGFPGAWLYVEDHPILHIIGADRPPFGPGILDHMAFSARGLESAVSLLKRHDISFNLKRFPHSDIKREGDWQLFFVDPNGAPIELNFDAAEQAPPSRGA